MIYGEVDIQPRYMLSLGCSRLIAALFHTAVSSSKAFAFSSGIAVDAWLRQYSSALLFTLLLNTMFIYGCATLVLLCCLRLMTALANTVVSCSKAFAFKNFVIAVDAWRHQHASSRLFVRLPMTDMHYIYKKQIHVFWATDWFGRSPTLL